MIIEDAPETKDSRETKLLRQYFAEKGGRLYVEVSVGGLAPDLWDGRAAPRWIDGCVCRAKTMLGLGERALNL